MEFETEAQQACYENVARWMKELFGEQFTIQRDDTPVIAVTYGSAVSQTGVFPWKESDALVNTRAYVVTGAELTRETLEYLLHRNDDALFGAFGLDDDGDILFEHSLLGSTCTKEDLRVSVMAVLTTADEEDEEIVSRWGGQRAADRLDEDGEDE